MTKFLKTLLMVFSTSILFAQQLQKCNFVPTASMLNTTNYSNRNTTLVDNGEKYVFNVKCHAIYGSNGENPNNIDDLFFLKIIADLNVLYNPSQIYFKYRGFNAIYDNSYFVYNGILPFSQLKNKFIQESLYDYSSINIFARRNFHGYPLPYEQGTDIVVSDLLGSTLPVYIQTQEASRKNDLAHFMGHVFGLLHTDHGSTAYGSNITSNLPSCIATLPIAQRFILKPNYFDYSVNNLPAYSENVTRNPLNLNYNADIAGDLVADTEASFLNCSRNFCGQNGSLEIPFFNVDARVKDEVNQVYVNLQNVYNNGMNGDFTVANTVKYTTGQRARIRETIAADADGTYASILNTLDDCSADLSVLYEPFSFGVIGASNPVIVSAYSKTTTPNTTNTGVNIWNCGPCTARYQTGFNQEFSNSAGQIQYKTPYEQYNSICSAYIGVKIPSIS